MRPSTVNRKQLVDFLIEEAGRCRFAHAGDHGDVEQFADAAFQAYPFDDVAAGKVDDLHAAPRFRIALLQFGVELKPRKGSISRQGQFDDGMPVVKGQPAQEAGTEHARQERARLKINRSDVTGA